MLTTGLTVPEATAQLTTARSLRLQMTLNDGMYAVMTAKVCVLEWALRRLRNERHTIRHFDQCESARQRLQRCTGFPELTESLLRDITDVMEDMTC